MSENKDSFEDEEQLVKMNPTSGNPQTSNPRTIFMQCDFMGINPRKTGRAINTFV